MGERGDDRPKKSWRERDAERDRGGGSAPRRDGPAARSASDRASQQYRAALEKLFDKGGVGKVAERLGAAAVTGPAGATRATAPTPPPDGGRAALHKKVIDAIGRDPVTRAVDRYLKEYPLPEEWDFLEQALEHRSDDRVREAFALLERMLQGDRPRRSRLLAAKLRFIEETTDDRGLAAAAAALRARLG